MKRILVASDGSEHAMVGVRYAIDLAHLTGAGLIGLHVSDLDCLPEERDAEAVVQAGPLADEDLREFAENATENALTDVMTWAAHAGFHSNVVVDRGNTADMILYHSDMRDMTVIGALGRNPARDCLLGPTVRGVVDGAIRPVLVARAPYRSIRRVLVAYERTAAAAAALSWVAPLASAAGWELLLVHGTDHMPKGKLVMEQASQFLAAYGVEAETRILVPAGGTHAVFEASRSYDPDIILVGARDRSAMARAIMGCTATDVLEQSGCAVVVFH